MPIDLTGLHAEKFIFFSQCVDFRLLEVFSSLVVLQCDIEKYTFKLKEEISIFLSLSNYNTFA